MKAPLQTDSKVPFNQAAKTNLGDNHHQLSGVGGGLYYKTTIDNLPQLEIIFVLYGGKIK